MKLTEKLMEAAIRDFITRKSSMSEVEAREEAAELNADIRGFYYGK